MIWCRGNFRVPALKSSLQTIGKFDICVFVRLKKTLCVFGRGRCCRPLDDLYSSYTRCLLVLNMSHRLCTLPYVSHKLPGNPHTLWPEQHDAVDDMESLFWALFEFCLTRKGPGNIYREEYREEFTMNLDEDNGGDHSLKAIKCLRLAVDRIFNVNDNSKPLEHKKEHIFEKPKILKIKSLFISIPISILSKVLC